MENGNQIGKQHKAIIMNRRVCNLTGVTDVISFDPQEVLLETEQGILTLQGQDLHVSRLTLEKGELDLDGRIDSASYSSDPSAHMRKESILKRLFQ